MFHQCSNSHYKNGMVSQPLYLYNQKSYTSKFGIHSEIDRLVQETQNSIANAMEL